MTGITQTREWDSDDPDTLKGAVEAYMAFVNTVPMKVVGDKAFRQIRDRLLVNVGRMYLREGNR